MSTVLFDTFTGGAAGNLVSTHTSDSGHTLTKHPRSGAATIRMDGVGGVYGTTGQPAIYLYDAVSATDEVTGIATVKRLGDTVWHAPRLWLRADPALAKGYIPSYNSSTERWELYRSNDDGTTRTLQVLGNWPAVYAVGAGGQMSVHIQNPDANTVWLDVAINGVFKGRIIDASADRIQTGTRIGLYHFTNGGGPSDGVHLDEITVNDAVAGALPIAPSGVTAAVAGATRADVSLVDESTDETHFVAFWAPDDGAGAPDEAAAVELVAVASSTGSATGGTVNFQVDGLLESTTGQWVGVKSRNANGDSAITWAAAPIDTPSMPVVNFISSPVAGTTVPPGTIVVLSATLTDAPGQTWWRGAPNAGGEQLGPNPYTYDTMGQLGGVQRLYIQGLNGYGDEALASIDLGIGSTRTVTSRGGEFMLIAQNEPDPESRTVLFDARNADGSAYPTAVEDGATVALGFDADGNPIPATNPPVARNAARGKYKVELTLAEVATAGSFEVGFPDKDGARLVQIQPGPVVSPNGGVPVSGYEPGQDPATLILATPANKLATNASGEAAATLSAAERTNIWSIAGLFDGISPLTYFRRMAAFYFGKGTDLNTANPKFAALNNDAKIRVTGAVGAATRTPSFDDS